MARSAADQSTTGQCVLVLASASPRRSELLHELCVNFRVSISPREEPRQKPIHASARSWASAVAYYKARAVAEQHPGEWVLGADTIVVCGAEILGKPLDAADARRMLQLQAGRASDVITGVCLLRQDQREVERLGGAVVTRVWMRDDAEAIEAYVESGDWQGKAGAYGIQDVGDRLIERLEGSFSNVVGLPIETVGRLLKLVGVC